MRLQPGFSRLPPWLRRHKVLQLLLRLRPAWRIQEVRLDDGTRVWADLRDANARTYFLRRSFEPEFFDVATAFLAPGGRFFDVGANFGFCTFGLLARIRSGLRSHLFEANPALCDLLRRSADLHAGRLVTVTHGCVTDRDGVSRLTSRPADTGSSFVSPDGNDLAPNLRLDDYCDRQGIRAVDFVKLDVEGCEALALGGAAGLLRRGALGAVYFENSAPLLRRQGFAPAAACRLLADAGYRIFFCKPGDLQRAGSRVRELRPAGGRVPVVECTRFDFSPTFQTDLLALPRGAPCLK